MFEAVSGYLRLASDHGLDPCAMALAFCRQRPFPCIPIIGATTLDQLRVNLGAADVVLSADVLTGIDAIHRDHPKPF